MPVKVALEPGFKGTVTGITRAGREQVATVTFYSKATGESLQMNRLKGKGEDVKMRQTIDNKPTIDFEASTEPMEIEVTIQNQNSAGKFVPSKQMEPITVRKDPDSINKDAFVVTTLLSEDDTDNDYGDCIITIFQFK